MDKFKDKVSHTEDKLPPEFDLVCAPVYNDSIFLPTINLKIRLMLENIENEENDENLFLSLQRKKEIEKANRKEDWEVEKMTVFNLDQNGINYDKIVDNNSDRLGQLNQEVLEISNCISVIFNEIEVR